MSASPSRMISQRSIASLLSLTLLVPMTVPMVAAEPAAAGKGLTAVEKQNLLLDRFTFGATPADRAAIKQMGAEAWLARQLQPVSIDDSALETRLDVYPAMRMTQDERLARYPEPATVRRMARTGQLPSNPELRAILSDQVEFYQMVQENKKTAGTGAANAPVGSPAMDGGDAGMGGVQAAMAQQGMQLTAQQQTALATVAKLAQSVERMPQAQVDAVLAMPANARYQKLLTMAPEELIALRKGLRGGQDDMRLSDGMTPLQKEMLLALSGTNRMMNAEVDGERLLRDVYSQRQLEAVMTDFWLNHFNVYDRKNGQMPSLLPAYAQTVRVHALGRFEDLLVATAQSPAMMMYLDNAQSVGPDSIAARRAAMFRGPAAKKQTLGLNENYAREIMELHTLGVNGGYTQQDVTELAKVLTGWTIERPDEGGGFTFNANRHEPGTKHVLGQTINQAGQSEGLQMLHVLATSPATAKFISTEIAQRFVSDVPPAAMVAAMQKTFLSSGGDIKAVLKTMVQSPEFYTSTTVKAKLKTPLEYVASALRVSGADVQNPLPVTQALERLGMPIFGCQPPTGWKWDEATWLSSSALVNRMNFALSLSTNRIAGTNVDWTSSLAGEGGRETKVAGLETQLFDGPVSAQTRAAVLSQGNDATAQAGAQQFARLGGGVQAMAPQGTRTEMNEVQAAKAVGVKAGGGGVRAGLGAAPLKVGPPPSDKDLAAMAGLLLGSPEFQRR